MQGLHLTYRRICEVLVVVMLALGIMFLPAPAHQPALAHQTETDPQDPASLAADMVSPPPHNLAWSPANIPFPTRQPTPSSTEIADSLPQLRPTLIPDSPASPLRTPNPLELPAKPLRQPTLKPVTTPILELPRPEKPTAKPSKPPPTPTPASTPEAIVLLPTADPSGGQFDDENVPMSPELGPRWGQPQYYFPYPSSSIKITRGGLGHHNGTGPAYDFAGPLGSPVLAGRSGTVVRADYSNDDPHCTLESQPNQVVIDHGDGTYGVYLHFSHSEQVLNEGDFVAVGDLIGYTGCTGKAHGAHVHFHVSDYFNKNDPKSSGYLSRRLEIWFFEAGEGDRVPSLDVYWYDVQWIRSQNPGQGSMPPAGDLILPLDGTSIEDPFEIQGWSVSEFEIDRVEVWLDDQHIGNANYDPFQHEPELECGNCGYQWQLDPAQYSPGGHVLMVKVYDKTGNYSQETRYVLFGSSE